MNLRLIGSVLAGLLACGITLWPVPYEKVSLPENPAGSTWFLLGAVAGLLAGYLLKQKKRVPVLAVAGGFVLAVLGRVAVETSRDPTSHNLWPFEVAIAGVIGLGAAVVGVGLARLFQRATAK
ncbi:MAG TPA: hypothetical protein VFB89_02580 [Gemmatimonadales bacterium]|nr:hypothetical protein [Gemmatimonadales bacterium]